MAPTGPPDARASAPLRALEHFELRAKRGSGGFATVYEGWDQALGRRVAIKIFDGVVGVDGELDIRKLSGRTLRPPQKCQATATKDQGRTAV